MGINVGIRYCGICKLNSRLCVIWQRSRVVGSVVEWLKRRAYGSTWSWFETHSRHSVVSLGKTLYGTFPCLVVLASSSKLQSYLY